MLQTGDLVLFHGSGWISKTLEWMGKSQYSHVGIIIINPCFLHPNLENGVYVWHSSWGEAPDNKGQKHVFGVQLQKLEDVIKEYEPHSVYVRHITAHHDVIFYQQLVAIHKEVHGKPYDLHIMDWIMAELQLYHPVEISALWKHTDRFWCSALVSYIYVRLGWIKDVNWSLIAPREYSSMDATGQVIFTCIVSDEVPLVSIEN